MSLIIDESFLVEWFPGIGDNELYISRDGGSTKSLITTVVSGEPDIKVSHLWTITGPTSDNCQFIVKDLFDNQEVILTVPAYPFSIIEEEIIRHETIMRNMWTPGELKGDERFE